MIVLRYLVAIVLCIGIVSCSDEEKKSAVLNVLQESTIINCDGGTVVATVTANESWVIEVDQNWLTAEPTYGRGNTEIKFNVLRNATKVPRSAIVSLKSGADVQSVVFTQNGQPSNSKPAAQVDCCWARRLEVPEPKSGNILHPVVTYESAVADSVLTFIYEWDPNRLHIRWTAFYFDAFTCQRIWKRKDWQSTEWGGDPWHDDMYLEESMRTTYDNHRGNGYDRGHMVASGDRLYSSQANLETYMYSNMSPQLAAFNQDYWVILEQKVQDWGADRAFCDTLYVCKGATIDKDEDILKVVQSLPVPKYYYMAIMKVKGGKYAAAGFLMEHKTEGYSKDMSVKPFAMSIDALEEKTGVNFFHNLPDDIETDIEASYKEGDWF